MTHIHLIGIGGTGLSAIARVLLEMGYTVSGSDKCTSANFDTITECGATTFLGHAPRYIQGADLVIRSSAIKDDNPEVVSARRLGIPVLKRADFLYQLTGEKATIAIAGTHGKTTTTAMVICMLINLEQDPSFIIGAVIKQLNTNAKAGKGAYFVIEADEYDHMFLGLNPWISLITNIEHDHPDCFPTPQDYQQAFHDFLDRTQINGTALLCNDDLGLQALITTRKHPAYTLMTYGINPKADYQAQHISINSSGCPKFDIIFKTKDGILLNLGTCDLQIPGEHNVRNALGALAIIHRLGLPLDKASQALANFEGTERRFDIVGEAEGITVINDYAHHPTQIRITMEAARQRFPRARLWAVWEPHTYSRTSTLADDFVTSFESADKVIITKIYAAREIDTGFTPIPIVAALPPEKGIYIPEFEDVVTYLLNNLMNNDVILVLSAGNALQISEKTFTALSNREKGK